MTPPIKSAREAREEKLAALNDQLAFGLHPVKLKHEGFGERPWVVRAPGQPDRRFGSLAVAEAAARKYAETGPAKIEVEITHLTVGRNGAISGAAKRGDGKTYNFSGVRDPLKAWGMTPAGSTRTVPSRMAAPTLAAITEKLKASPELLRRADEERAAQDRQTADAQRVAAVRKAKEAFGEEMYAMLHALRPDLGTVAALAKLDELLGRIDADIAKGGA
jgi:hypothetical protein